MFKGQKNGNQARLTTAQVAGKGVKYSQEAYLQHRLYIPHMWSER